MSEINWDIVFPDQTKRKAGASDAEINNFLETLYEPISSTELDRLQSYQDVESWILPQGTLPDSYLSLLRWSNGGEFRNGERLIQFFPATESQGGVREMMLGYAVPRRFPGLLPFAFNGGFIFYAFDMRFKPIDGEYKIVAAECGHSHSPFPINSTFPETCQSPINFETAWDEDDEITRPMCDECSEYLTCPNCGRRGPVEH